MKTVRLVDRSNDANHASPEMALEDVLRDFREGKRKATKAIVITLDSSGDKYEVHWYQAGMKTSEIVALLEYTKADMIGLMNEG